jgi:hypothetical protein
MPTSEGYGKLPASRVVGSAATGMDAGRRGWKLGRDTKLALVGWLVGWLAEVQALV